MAVAVFNSCCFCIQLRLGCLIYAYLELVGTVYNMIYILALPKAMRMVVEELRRSGDTVKVREFDGQTVETVIRVVVIIAIICLCIRLMFVVTFLVGLHKNKRSLVGVYLIFSAIFQVISIIVIIVVFVMLSQQDQLKIPEALWVTQIITLIFSYLLLIYFWMVIRSHYQKMDINTGNEQAIYRA